MINNTSMPRSTVIPELGYADVRQAVEWLIRTFGFQERLRIGEHRAQLSFGSGHLVVMEAAGASDASTALRHATMVRVADVDAHCAHARQAGAHVSCGPETFAYGERQYSVRDPSGHLWTFSQSVADVDPASWGGTLNDDAA